VHRAPSLLNVVTSRVKRACCSSRFSARAMRPSRPCREKGSAYFAARPAGSARLHGFAARVLTGRSSRRTHPRARAPFGFRAHHPAADAAYPKRFSPMPTSPTSIHAYLRSLPKARDYTSIPLLNP